jgi:hypothetical protein
MSISGTIQSANGMDFELKSSLKVLTEIKKKRALSMSFDNLLTEVWNE